MNTQQRKYAMERVAAIKSSREAKLKADLDKLRKTVLARDLLGPGLVKKLFRMEQADQPLTYHTRVESILDLGVLKGPTDEEQAAYNAAMQALAAETEAVKDQIMLGDTEEALRLLSAFAAGTPL